MERLFRNLSWLSASFVLVALLATLVALYVSARPAIESFGWRFIVDSRWDVSVPLDDAAQAGEGAALAPVDDTPADDTIEAADELDAGFDTDEEDDFV